MGETTTDKIADLRELKEAGAISAEEFASMRNALLKEDVIRAPSAPPPPQWPSSRADTRPAVVADTTKVVRFMHFALGGMALIGAGFSMLMMIPLLAVGESSVLLYLLGTVFWGALGAAQIALGIKMDGNTPGLYGPSLAISALYAMSCSIFGGILVVLHMTSDVQRDLS